MVRMERTDQGTQLKIGGDTRFNALMSGARFYPAGNFANMNLYTYYYSSTTWPDNNKVYRAFKNDYSTIIRTATYPNSSLSIRCIKD